MHIYLSTDEWTFSWTIILASVEIEWYHWFIKEEVLETVLSDHKLVYFRGFGINLECGTGNTLNLLLYCSWVVIVKKLLSLCSSLYLNSRKSVVCMIELDIFLLTGAVSIVIQDRLYNIKTWMPQMTLMPSEVISSFCMFNRLALLSRKCHPAKSVYLSVLKYKITEPKKKYFSS